MMGTRTLAKEKPLHFTQLAIIKASCALSEVVKDLLSSTALDTRVLVTTITDVLALLGHAHVTLSHKRRDVLSPDLKKCYSGLTSPDVPITTILFGDDILKTMADLKKTNSVQYEAKYSRPKKLPCARDRGYQINNQFKGKQPQQRYKPHKKQQRPQLPITPQIPQKLTHTSLVKMIMPLLSAILSQIIVSNKRQAGRLKAFKSNWRELTTYTIIGFGIIETKYFKTVFSSFK